MAVWGRRKWEEELESLLLQWRVLFHISQNHQEFCFGPDKAILVKSQPLQGPFYNQSRRLSAQCGFSKQDPLDRQLWVGNRFPDCPTAGLTGKPTLSKIGKGSSIIAFIYFWYRLFLGKCKSYCFSFASCLPDLTNFSLFMTWIPFFFFYW